MLDQRAYLSGLEKGDFFIESCLHQKIVTIGNVKTFTKWKEQLDRIERHIEKIEKTEEVDVSILESLREILEIYAGLKNDK